MDDNSFHYRLFAVHMELYACAQKAEVMEGSYKEIEYVSSFTKISSLLGHEIRVTYAGYSHSLFETRKGKILSCGDNKYGELLLSSGTCEVFVYLPIETTITSGSTFCITRNCISVVFIGSYPPPNTLSLQISAFTFLIFSIKTIILFDSYNIFKM